MRVEIATIGDEVLEGRTINANGALISRALSEKGYEVCRQTVLPMDSEALFMGLKELLDRSTLVVATGGLGSLMNDATKLVATRLFCTSLQIDSSLYDDLLERYGSGPAIEEMARVPRNSIVLPNRIGTAPGFLFLSTEGSLLLLPGTPREMEHMFHQSASPLLAEHFPVVAKQQSLHLHLCQISEHALDPILREIQSAHPDARIDVYPSLGTLEVRFSVSRDFGRMDQWAELIRKAFPTFLFDGPSIHEAVHRAMIARGQTLALAESCTGGALSARLVLLPGASKYLLGSIVAYSDAFKERFLHVSPKTLETEGPVSIETAGEMVQGLFQTTRADYAIAITGWAGTGAGSASIPAGTIFIAVGKRGGSIDCGRIQAPPDRAGAIELAVQYALGALWRRITYQAMTFL
ncbi:MAG: cinA [Parachlamydiales bacterium]|nr:cinA [Parachlamydiales bacterium]